MKRINKILCSSGFLLLGSVFSLFDAFKYPDYSLIYLILSVYCFVISVSIFKDKRRKTWQETQT